VVHRQVNHSISDAIVATLLSQQYVHISGFACPGEDQLLLQWLWLCLAAASCVIDDQWDDQMIFVLPSIAYPLVYELQLKSAV